MLQASISASALAGPLWRLWRYQSSQLLDRVERSGWINARRSPNEFDHLLEFGGVRNLATDNSVLRRVPHLELAAPNFRSGDNFKIGEWHIPTYPNRFHNLHRAYSIIHNAASHRSGIEDNGACFIVRDHGGQALAQLYYENEPGRRAAANLLTRDEVRWIAVNVAKLPELVKRPQY